MLGKYVHAYIPGSIGIGRRHFEATDFTSLRKLDFRSNDVVINCIGITNKKDKEPNELYVVNSLFPRVLADYCERSGAKLIHITTDCVFSGKMEGSYWPFDHPDARDTYGISKFLGEPRNCTVIRSSFIGENTDNSLDLLEWVRSHHNATVNGWTNHMWNGITCLQFAKICDMIIKSDTFWEGVRHIHSPNKVSKYELVSMINDIYQLGNTIVPMAAPAACDRVLSGSPKGMHIPDIRTQIIEQKNFAL